MPLVTTPLDEANAQVSPDGKWLAYQSNETGEGQIYVRPFPTGSGKWQMSTSGGFAPRWRGDGRELFYLDPQYKLFAVSVQFNSSAVEAGVPKPLFDSGYVTLNSHGAQPHHAYAVLADGQRFLIPRPATNRAPDSSAPIAVVLNWAQGIQH